MELLDTLSQWIPDIGIKKTHIVMGAYSHL